MPLHPRSIQRFVCLTALAVGPLVAADIGEQAASILDKNCTVCHGAAMQQSRLDLRTREKILLGGERGPAVVPYNLKRSWLWKLANHQVNPAMPPGSKLPDEDLAVLGKWIESGAPFPERPADAEEAAKIEALRKLEERPITAKERAWWAFQPVRRVEPPAGSSAGISAAIDRFVDAGLREHGLIAAPPADKRTLVRRAYLDLVGLPPTPEQVSAFVEDEDPDAWGRLIDHLLDSPHYGERWGRYWLDLVHYADSGGYERDFDWPTMWRYRDYVVEAFNSDKPYDRFILEQIAGDEIGLDSAEAHIATGYLRMVLDNNIKDERTRMDELDDNVATTALSFLGMTVQCARCHNHKFDAIPQQDYYRMQAVFFSTKEVDYPLVPQAEVAAYDAAEQAVDDQQKPLRAQIKQLEKPHREQLFEAKLDALPGYYRTAWETPAAERSEGQRLNARQVDALFGQIKLSEVLELMSDDERTRRDGLEQAIAALDNQRPAPYATARAIAEAGPEPLPSFFLHRGNPDSKGSRMDPGVLTAAAPRPVVFEAPDPGAESSHRRRQFAEWIASKDNPLTARVMVNRIWQHHFGEGIVRSPSNYGVTGQKPTHPELLDSLAAEFMAGGWSVKHMHRLMLHTAAYKRSSDDLEANLAADSDNRYLWRMGRGRLEAEIIRDQMLAVAGTLDLEVGGEAVRPYINPDLWQSATGRVWGGRPIGHPSTWRRSLYVFSKRSIRYPLFEAFDQPDMVSSCSRRNSSTVAPQALLLMNNAEILRQAKFFAQRLVLEAGYEPDAQVEHAFQLALVRSPSTREKRAAVAFVKENPTGLVDFCQTLFNLNEFVYRQ